MHLVFVELRTGFVVFACTHKKTRCSEPVYLIKINIQVSDCGILFVQVPESFFFVLFLLLVLLLLSFKSEAKMTFFCSLGVFQMPEPHSGDPLTFQAM